MRAILPIVGLIAYALLAHAVISWHRPALAVVAVVVLSAAALVAAARDRGRRGLWLAYAALLVVAIINLLTDSVHAVFIPSIVVNAVLAIMTLVSLRRGSVPLLERVFRLQYPHGLAAPVQREVRRLTWIWAVFFLVSAAVSLGLALFAPLQVWSLFANVLYFALLAAVIAIMHTYQHFRFRGKGFALSLGVMHKLIRLDRRDPAHPFSCFGNGVGR